MKKRFLFLIFITLTMNVMAQSVYDCIDRDEFFLIRTDVSTKSVSPQKASLIKSRQEAELQFGKNYEANREFGQMTEEYYTKMIYDDGLSLWIPENQKLHLDFTVTSDRYALLLADCTQIQVGMKAEDLKAIFPKSYSKRKVSSDIPGREGKIYFQVFFTFKSDDKVYADDSWINFILSEENGVLEEFYSYEPQ